jgi:uncharacterized protein (TIRG00374 family)
MDIKVKKRLLWAILISIGFMFFLLTRVDWGHLSLIVNRLEIQYLVAACSVYILGNLVRTFRFYHLDHMDNRLTLWWNINAFYNVVTATLPGGAGEAASVYILKRFSKFNLLGALRILFLSRLLDLFALSALFLLAAIQISVLTPYRNIAIFMSGALLILSLILLLPSSEQFILKLTKKLPGQGNVKKRLRDKLSELINISEEQRRHNTFRVALLQSVLMMVAGVVSVHMLLRSFGIHFTPVQSAYCYGVYMLFQIVPVQGVAGIGTQAAWWALALNSAGYRGADTIALGFMLHGTFYVFIAIIGLSALLIWPVIRKNY